MNLSYSSIDEVWPDFNKKPKKKKISDPICDLYEKNDAKIHKYAVNDFNKARFQKNENSHRLSHPKDVVIEPEQNKYDINNNPPPISSEFEKQFEISNESQKNEYDDDDITKIMSKIDSESKSFNDYRFDNSQFDHSSQEIYDHEPQYIKPESHIRPESRQRWQQTIPPENYYRYKESKDFDDFIYDKISTTKSNSTAILDIILYIVSGIILIFLMEQFIRIGSHFSLNRL